MTILTTNDPTHRITLSATGNRADTFISTRYVFPVVNVPSTPRTFADEKDTFRSMLPMLLARFAGEYVAVAGGAIVDHDSSRMALVRRFFASGRDVPVYIGLVGPRDIARIPTPFVRRRP